MTQPKRPLKVFLCHAHADRDAVRALYTRLTNDGVDAWLDKAKLLPGQDWELEIRKAVREADVVVVCLSKQFNQRGFRQKEVRLALDTAMEMPEGEIFIIPARLEECDNLESLRKWHWVDLFDEDGYEMLMRALRARANKIGATLQVKKSWLPKITSPLLKKQKPAENKKAETADEKTVNNIDDISPSPELPDEWEAQWQAGFVKNAKEEKETVETTDTKVDRPSAKKIRRPNTTLIVSFIVLVMASIFGLPSLFDTPMDDVPTATQTKGEVALETQTLKPSSTPSSPISTKTSSFTATPTPLPTEITDAKGVLMVLIPAGEFIMGSESEYFNPEHVVDTDSYYIDKYEVTNLQYKKCVDIGVCTELIDTSRYENPSYSNHPVTYLQPYQADLFCGWRGGRLPTETEWEKAARGTDGRSYPWGEEPLTCARANTSRCIGDTTEVGSYEFGISPYGVYDMVGNVEEITSSTSYSGSRQEDERILRGGSWMISYGNGVYYNNNVYQIDSNKIDSIGFRCAKDVIP